MDKEFIICVGISGSGKSTWTTQFLKDNHNYLRINRDDIRKTLVGNLDGYYQRKDLKILEDMVTDFERQLLGRFYGKYNVILDNTNVQKKVVEEWINILEKTNNFYDKTFYDFKFKLFNISLQEAKERVYNRDNKEMKWSDSWEHVKYIEKQYNQYQNIKKWIEQTYPDKILC